MKVWSHTISYHHIIFLFVFFLTDYFKSSNAARRLKRKTFVRIKHDTNVRQFSPQGEIQQIQYANEAIKKGNLLIGVVAKDGVVMIAEKASQSALFVRPCLPKLNAVGTVCGVGLAGLLPDGRMLVQKAREIVQDHWFQFGEQVGVEKLIMLLSQLVQKFHGFDEDEAENSNEERENEDETLSRPVGVAVMLAGLDHNNRYALYLLEPSGAFLRWKAKAIGFGSDVFGLKLAATEWSSMTVEEAKYNLLVLLKNHFEDEDFSSKKLEIATLDKNKERKNESELRFITFSESQIQESINSCHKEKQ
mmetsp:Transcript_3221/g.4120  ORF Transcript_3221/g.4120 Transcript_3221/m.4120 type:complete len:305 (+) Transcript_3221:142-1056(+)